MHQSLALKSNVLNQESTVGNKPLIHLRKPVPGKVTSPAKTEYDGEDVVMHEASYTETTPQPSITEPKSIATRKATPATTRLRPSITRVIETQKPSTPLVALFDKVQALINAAKNQTTAAVTPSTSIATTVAIEDQTKKCDSPEMSSNPLASVSPCEVIPSISSGSGISSNPLYAGTPCHPTPPSVSHPMRPLAITMTTPLTEKPKILDYLTNAAANSFNTANKDSANKLDIFKEDVAKLLQVLDASTPVVVSREEKLLDLDGFDSNGEKIVAGRTPYVAAAIAQVKDKAVRRSSPHPMHVSSEAMRARLSEAEDRAELAESKLEDASMLLRDYQGTISAMQDSHSAALAKAEAETNKHRAEFEALAANYQEVQHALNGVQIAQVAPLKEENEFLKKEITSLKRALDREVLKSSELQFEMRELSVKIQQAQQQVSVADSERNDARQMVDITLEKLERAQLEVARREDEVCMLTLKLKDIQAQNINLNGTKDRLKGVLIASEQERSQLVTMCNELVARLEKEGLSLSPESQQ